MLKITLPYDLHVAVMCNNIQAVKKIIQIAKENCISINRPVQGRTALSLALLCHRTTCFGLILEHVRSNEHYSVDTKSRNHHGEYQTPLILATLKRNSEAVLQILKAHCDPNILDVTSHSALWFCVRQNLIEIAWNLIQHGSSLNTYCGNKWTLIYTALKYERSSSFIKVLLYYNCEILDTTNKEWGGSLVIMAARQNKTDLVHILVDLGVLNYDQGRRRSEIPKEGLSGLSQYIESHLRNPSTLKCLCRLTIREAMRNLKCGEDFVQSVLALPHCPPSLKRYLLVDDLCCTFNDNLLELNIKSSKFYAENLLK